jgi:peptide/nickel transport system substrate-binding protein
LAWRGAQIALSALLLASCSNQADPAEDHLIRVGVAQVPPAIGNPYQGVTIPSTLALQAVFDTVTILDEKGDPQPNLALEWREETPLSWIIKLRPDVRFSNGEPMNADALLASVAHMTSKFGRMETIGSTLYQIDGAEKIDELTLRIRLNEADPLFPVHIAIWRVPAPKQWASLKLPEEAKFALGTGPFVVEQRGDGRMLLKANPYAWRKPAVDKLELVAIADATARLQAFVSGAVDMSMGLSRDAVIAVERVGGTLTTRLTPQVDFMAANTERRDVPLDDVRLRLAINYAVNREMMTTYILGGVTKPASQLSVPGAFGYDPNLKPIPYDPAKAKQLLREAGYPNGLSLQMNVSTGDVAGDAIYYQQIGNDLKKVGINLTIINRPMMRQLQDIFSGKSDGDLFNMNTRGSDPIIDYRFRSCQRPSPARQAFHCDPTLVEMTNKAAAEPNIEARRKLYAEIARYERDHPPGLILWQRPDFDAVSARVKGYSPVYDVLRLEQWQKVAS